MFNYIPPSWKQDRNTTGMRYQRPPEPWEYRPGIIFYGMAATIILIFLMASLG